MEAAQPHGMSLGGRPFCPKTSTGRARAVMDDIGRWTLLWSWLSLRVTVRLRFHARMMERVRGHKRKKRRIGIYWNILKHSEKQKQRGLSWRHFQNFPDMFAWCFWMFNSIILMVEASDLTGSAGRSLHVMLEERRVILCFCGLWRKRKQESCMKDLKDLPLKVVFVDKF